MPIAADPATTVLVDMDGVLCDFDSAVLRGLPDDLERVPRSNFYIAKDYPDHKALVAEVYSHPEFFYELEPIDGAVEGWQRLVDLGYSPRICSAPLTLNPKSVEGKQDWLRRHLAPAFGESVVDDAIFDKQKHLYQGLAIIDDRPTMETGDGPTPWTHIVFDAAYNRHVPDSVARLRGWRDPNLGPLLDSLVARGSVA